MPLGPQRRLTQLSGGSGGMGVTPVSSIPTEGVAELPEMELPRSDGWFQGLVTRDSGEHSASAKKAIQTLISAYLGGAGAAGVASGAAASAGGAAGGAAASAGGAAGGAAASAGGAAGGLLSKTADAASKGIAGGTATGSMPTGGVPAAGRLASGLKDFGGAIVEGARDQIFERIGSPLARVGIDGGVVDSFKAGRVAEGLGNAGKNVLRTRMSTPHRGQQAQMTPIVGQNLHTEGLPGRSRGPEGAPSSATPGNPRFSRRRR